MRLYGSWDIHQLFSSIPWGLLEMQVLSPTPDLLNHRLWGWDLTICFNEPCR